MSTSDRTIQPNLGHHFESAADYLLQLEQAIRAYRVDARALHDFRLATNQVRETAWVVEQWLAEHENGTNGHSALPALHAHLVHRAAEANRALLAELDTNAVAAPPEELSELLASIGTLQKRLARLVPAR